MEYRKGKIYKLVSNGSNDVYYGSTTRILSYRLTDHKSDYKGYLNGKRNYRTSFELMKLGDAQIILVEDYRCDTKKELLARERFYIENNICVNKEIPGRTIKEWREDNKEYDKEYYKKNKDKISKRTGRKIICKCGRVIRFGNIAQHKKSLIHQELISE